MEGKSQSRLLLVTAVALVAMAIVLMIVVPGATRVSMIVEHGIKTADMIQTGYYVVGALLITSGGYLGFRGYQIVQREAQEATARRERERPLELPSRNETDLRQIIPKLEWVADRYPQTSDEIGLTLAHQRSFRESLAAIDQIFRANPGIIISGDTEFNFASYELLLQRVIDGTCNDLVSIIYQAAAVQDFSIERLEAFVDQVNQTNIERIRMANDLAFKAAESVPQVDKASNHITYAPEQLRQLLIDLSETKTTLQEGPQ